MDDVRRVTGAAQAALLLEKLELEKLEAHIEECNKP
jgi:hypothetical protein